jgi:hypothetical protein
VKSKLFSRARGWKIIIQLIFFFALIFSFNNKSIAQVSLTVKFYIQGYYIGNNLMTPVLYNQCLGSGSSPASCIGQYPLTDVDDATIELHDKNNYSLVSGGSFSGRVHTDGTISCLFSVPADDYYIVVIYQNSLQTWSNGPVSLSSTPIVYDFSVSANMAYGDNQTTEFYIHSDAFGNATPVGGVGGVNGNLSTDGVFKFFSGDISDAGTGSVGAQDGIIESQDFADMENGVWIMIGGFYIYDLNGDGGVDLLDFIIMERGVYFVRYSIIP